ncbi:MAG: MFS transporter [Gammaproteobacteria bacterium]|jgi:UMF1 family MFS transporter|nr:MFS transporter [Gammaproteobacteria bacterium]
MRRDEPVSVTPEEGTIPRRAVAGWVSYDLANTIFSMGVVSLFLPMWLREEMGADRVDAGFGLVAAISYAIVFLISPQLGAMTDRAGRRMPFLLVSTLLCVLCTVLLGRFGIAATLVLFVLANVAYQAGLQFYDALLPQVSTPRNRGIIGGIGVGIGYFGSFIAVGLGIVLGTGDKEPLFLWIGTLFLLFALPCFFFVRERPAPRRGSVWSPRAMYASMRETLRTLRRVDEHPGLLRFLIGRVFYTDAINTVIMVMALYTVNVAVATGLDTAAGERAAQFVLIFAIGFAVPGGFVWGWVTDRYGPKRTLEAVLLLWMAVLALAAVAGMAPLSLPWLYVVAASAGIALAGVWAADRPYMLRLSPPDRIGEFYGLYGMVGRFSAVTGPAIWGGIFWFTVQVLGLEPRIGQGIGILLLGLQMFVGWLILRKVSLR